MFGTKMDLLFLGTILFNIQTVFGQACVNDLGCTWIEGGVCGTQGLCRCPPGQEAINGGFTCVDSSPYYGSACRDTSQCANLQFAFECQITNGSDIGTCSCQDGFQYWNGRCQPFVGFGEACVADSQCLGNHNPYSLRCLDGTCSCAEDFYLRQRGECRKIASAVGDGCILDDDCQFENGVCDYQTLMCIDSTAVPETEETDPTSRASSDLLERSTVRLAGSECVSNDDCTGNRFFCSAFNHCVCERGFVPSTDGTTCIAELGQSSTEEECQAPFAVWDNSTEICSCQTGFFYDETLTSCIKPNIRFDDSCVSDISCHTFGAAGVCRDIGGFGIRGCRCDESVAVLELENNICRLFSAIGEECEVDSDCVTGPNAVLCQVGDTDDVPRCTCPQDTAPSSNNLLCLVNDLGLNDTCQDSAECSTEFSSCVSGVCGCSDGYVQVDQVCRPAIGTTCLENADCGIEGTFCNNGTCRCVTGTVEDNDVCLPESSGLNDECSVTSQCISELGEGSVCLLGSCQCDEGYHYKNQRCWVITELSASCSRSGECYLPVHSDRVVCRNEVCQCDFDYPLNDEGFCGESSSANNLVTSSLLLGILMLLQRYHC